MSACAKCKNTLTKLDEPKRIEARKQPDGSIQYFGIAQDLERLDKAKGKMFKVYHYRCYFVMKKHDRMGPNGRYLDDSPTAYEMAEKYTNRDDLQADEVERVRIATARLTELQALKSKMDEGDTFVEFRPGGEELDLESLLSEAEAEVKLAERQAEIAAERDKEETPRGFADWRDPATLDI